MEEIHQENPENPPPGGEVHEENLPPAPQPPPGGGENPPQDEMTAETAEKTFDIKSKKKWMMLFLSCIIVSVEIVSALVEFDKIKGLKKSILPTLTIGIACGGLGLSCFNYWAISKSDGAKWKRHGLYGVCLCAHTDEPNENPSHCWGSSFHILGILFWAAHLLLTIADALSKWLWDREISGGFSVYPAILALVELTHAIFAFFYCFERRYYIFCKAQNHVLLKPKHKKGCVMFHCPSCKKRWCPSPNSPPHADI